MRWFLPLVAAGGVAMSLTAPLEVVFAREFWHTGLFIGIFMLTASVGVIAVDVFGTRFIPGLDARITLTVGLVVFGVACIGIGLASGGVVLMVSRVLQGIGGGVVLGAGLQAAVRVRPIDGDVAQSVGRFNAAFLFGGAIGSPGGLLVASFIDGRLGYQTAFVGTGVLA
jgi:MFS family permease